MPFFTHPRTGKKIFFRKDDFKRDWPKVSWPFIHKHCVKAEESQGWTNACPFCNSCRSLWKVRKGFKRKIPVPQGVLLCAKCITRAYRSTWR